MYGFDTIYNRVGTGTIAVDALSCDGKGAPKKPLEGFSIIPMWIADMSFPTFPGIVDSIEQRLQHPFFGYFMQSDKFYNGVQWWQNNRNGVEVPRECICLDQGVLGGVVSSLRAIVGRGGSVLVHSPTYIGFTKVLKNNGYNVVLSELKKDENGTFRMDFADMEEKIIANHIHCCIFCAPHNPTGRVWTAEELQQMYALFEKYDVSVISDEIWSDLILFGNRHIPAQSVSEWAKMNTVSLYAIGKTFSCAGFVNSYRIIYNPTLRDKIELEAGLSHYNEFNMLTQAAYEGALTPDGAAWLDELLPYLSENVKTFCRYLEGKGVPCSKPEGTYMVYAEFGPYLEKRGISLDELLNRMWDYGVIGQNGEPFHTPKTVRFNLALPYTMLCDAMERMDKYVFEV